ncbi:MAG: FmdB family zinc ribbon protein [Acidobacteriaceae bacterium]
MPLYEYRCKKCGHQFEKIQSFSAPDEKECPKCKGELERLISAPAFQFKGAGWYVNDYAAKGKGPSAKSSDASGNDKAGAAESKPAETKTAGSSAASSAASSSKSE